MTRITSLFLLCMLMLANSYAQTAAPKFNYGEALQKSLFFYECQRSGDLTDPRYKPNRVTWRANSTMTDKGTGGEDLTGGWFDAGDHVKFGFPMAYSATMLAWGAIEYKAAYKQAGQWDELLDNLRWVNDYFIKCHTGPREFYGQVGNGAYDHAVWVPAEVLLTKAPNRPAYKVTASAGGSDLLGETAAAMAASSMVFAEDDPAYSAELLTHAKQLYEFADAVRARYTGAIPDAASFYNSWSGYNDELVWGAIWLYKATNSKPYLDKAEQYYDNLNTEPQVPTRSYKWGLAWDDKSYGCYVLLSILTGKNKYTEDAERSLDYWTTGTNGSRITYTPGGLAWLTQWGSLRHTANTAFLAFLYSDFLPASNTKKSLYYNFAVRQINYTLGENPSNRSYMCGFGVNPPKNPHHRTAHGGWENNVSGAPATNRHILYGALVGGPGNADDYVDDRSDYQKNEVATDYNAAYTGALIRMYKDFGGAPLANFPIAEIPSDELYMETKVNSSGVNFMEPSFTAYNHTAWPARVTPNISFRYFIDITEGLAAGYTLANYTVSVGYSSGTTTTTQLLPWDQTNNIYYFEVSFPGAALYPGGQGESRKEAQVRVKLPDAAPAAAWNNANDWSYLAGAAQNRNPKVPMYDNGVLIFGQEPPKDSPVAVIGVTPTSAQGYAPFAVSFSGAGSTDPTGSALTYAWTFGDGTTGTGKTAAHTYTTAGSYTAKLTVTNAAGRTGTATKVITVLSGTPTAVVTATPTSGDVPLVVAFSGAGSTDPNGDVLTYSWNFGDATPAGTGVSVSHTYTAVGSYIATLTVNDGKGGTNSKTVTITVNDTIFNRLPVAVVAATPTSGTAPLVVAFSGAGSTDPDGDVLTYSWNFGDTTPAGTGVSVSHTYTAAGSYIATLTVNDGKGGTSSKSVTITVTSINRPPVAVLTATPMSGSAPLTVSLSAAGSTDPDGDALTYSWDFGNGTTGTGVSASKTYPVGEYVVKVTVSDGRGGVSTATKTITVGLCNLLTRFGVPRATPLPTTNYMSFDNIYVLGNAPAGLLSNAYKPVINWGLENNGLWQLSLNTRNGVPNWYVDLRNATTHTFNAPQPKITFANSGFPGLDGTYYINIDANGLALVATTGAYAIYWTNSTTPPAGCPTAARSINATDAGSLELFALPNPTTGLVRINGLGSQYESVTVYDMTGKVQIQKHVPSVGGTIDLDMSRLHGGIYYLKATGKTTSKTLRIVKQ